MECFNCKVFYNDNHNSPRLLTDCGHSICSQCLKLNYRNQTVICPECKTPNQKESISLFPKNLALLYMKPPSNVEKSMRTSIQPETSLQISRDLKGICLKHNKKLEGFCESDRQLLCVSCILQEGYKDKNICTIQDAAEKERSLIGKACQLAKATENRCKMLQSSIVDGYKVVAVMAEKSCEEITSFFNEIRNTLTGRETCLKKEIVEKQRKEQEVIKARENTVVELMNEISFFYQNYKQSLKEDDISLLSSSAQRNEFIRKITTEPENFKVEASSFKNLDRQKELNAIWNVLSPLDERQIQQRPQISEGLRIVKNLSDGGNLKSDKNQSSIMSTSMQRSTKQQSATKQQQPTVASTLRGAWANRKPEKVPKAKPQSGLVSPAVHIKEVEKSKRTVESQKLVERIAELDCDYRGDATSGAQVPYNSQDMRPNYAEKQSNSMSVSRDFFFQQKGEPLQLLQPSSSASVITINLNDESPPYHQTNSKPHLTYASQKPKEKLQKSKSNLNTYRYEEESHVNETKSEIKLVDSSYSSSFHTNGELLDLLNPVDLSKRLEANMQAGKTRSQQFQMPTFRGMSSHKEKSYLNMSKESFLDFDKENLKINHQQSMPLSSRELPKKNNISVLPKDILDSSQPSMDHILQERRHSDINDTTMNKFDWSAICQSVYSYIYIIDGCGQNSYSQVEKLDVQKSQWEYGGTLQGNRSRFSAVVLPDSGNILIMGGKEKKARTANCEEYVVSHRAFRPSNIKLKCEKSGFGALIHRDEIFICGGNTGKAILRSFESYNLNTGTWKVLPPLKQTRDELGLAIGPDQRIYAVGGIGGPNMTPLNTVERYDPEKKEWEYVASLNVARRALSVVSLPDGIYAIGGYDGNNYLNTVERYDDTTNRWVLVRSMSHARCRAAAVVSSDYRDIYIFGGENYETLNSVERYSVIKDQWELMEPMRIKRSMHAAVITSK